MALIDSVSAALGVNGGTTGALDSTGANFLVAGVVGEAMSANPTDSKSNTWNALTLQVHGPDTQFWWSVPTSVGAGHTLTFSESDSYSAAFFAAFSLIHQVDPFDSENGAEGNPVNALNAGSVTPAVDSSLIVTLLGWDTAISALTLSGFTIPESVVAVGGTNYGGALGYVIQGTAAAINPPWDWTTDARASARVAVFAPAAASSSGAGVNRGLEASPLTRSAIVGAMRRVGNLFVPDHRIIRPRYVPGFAF